MKKRVQINYLSDMDRIFDDSHAQNVIYATPTNMKVSVGDIVLVERYYGSMTIGQVQSVHDYDNERAKFSKEFSVLAVITDSCSVFKQKYNDVTRARTEREISDRVRQLDQKQVYDAYHKWIQS